jgi:DNA-binding response OmpR family regulator
MTHRVLIIEDNADLAAGIVYNLEREGMEVHAVETAGAGLDEVEQWTPHVVVLDLMLPDRDGYEFLE